MASIVRPLLAAAPRRLGTAALPPCTCAVGRSTVFARLKHSKKPAAPVGSKKTRPSASEVDLSTYEAERREGETFDVGALQKALVEAVDRFRVDLKPLVGRISELSPAMLDRIRVKTEDKDPPTVPLVALATVETVRGGLEIRAYDPTVRRTLPQASLSDQTTSAIEAALARDGLSASVINQSTLRIAAPRCARSASGAAKAQT